MKSKDAFTKDGLCRHQCRGCAKLRLQRMRKGSLARHLYFNLMQQMRKKGRVERAYWCLQDVECLLQQQQQQQVAAGPVRIARVDENRPWLAADDYDAGTGQQEGEE